MTKRQRFNTILVGRNGFVSKSMWVNRGWSRGWSSQRNLYESLAWSKGHSVSIGGDRSRGGYARFGYVSQAIDGLEASVSWGMP